jgi:alkylation response protein AidB-like acyl-CoA dehydrogenase
MSLGISTAASPLTTSRDAALHAAIDIGIARAALEDGAKFVRTRARPWQEAVDAGIERADREPHVGPRPRWPRSSPSRSPAESSN